MALLSDGELAVTKGVPELDGSVAGAGDNLAVVGREGDGENIAGVAAEDTGGVASRKFPQAQSLVPRGRQSIGTVRRDNLWPFSQPHTFSQFTLI